MEIIIPGCVINKRNQICREIDFSNFKNYLNYFLFDDLKNSMVIHLSNELLINVGIFIYFIQIKTNFIIDQIFYFLNFNKLQMPDLIYVFRFLLALFFQTKFLKFTNPLHYQNNQILIHLKDFHLQCMK